MKGIFTKTDDNKLIIELSKEVYAKDAIMTAAYNITNLCTILIRPSRENNLEVVFEPKKELPNENLERIANEFCNNVLDEQIRLDLEKRYGNIRELIVKHAFSPLENLKEFLDES